MCKIVIDADGLIKLGKAGLLESLLENQEVLVPARVYEEAVVSGKLEQYEDARELERTLEKNRASIYPAKADPRAGELLSGTPSLGAGERAALHLYHAEHAAAILSDDRVFLRFLSENSIPYLTPASVIVRFVEIGNLGQEDGLAALERLRKHIRESAYGKVREDLERQGGGGEDG